MTPLDTAINKLLDDHERTARKAAAFDALLAAVKSAHEGHAGALPESIYKAIKDAERAAS